MSTTTILRTKSYKGYTGSYMWNNEAQVYQGTLNNMSDVITFRGKTIKDMIADFEDAVEDYILHVNSELFD